VDEVLAVDSKQLAPCNPDWCGSLAIVLHDLGRGGEFVAAVPRAHKTNPWVLAAQAIAEGDFARAADQYAAIGSEADEAYARLRAGEQLVANGRGTEAVEQLTRATDFFRRAHAVAYLRETQDLLRRADSEPV
jgi:thioredoxin-like negative regulator of GroEL